MDGRLPLSLDDYENSEYWKIYYLEQGLKEYIEEKNEQEKKLEKERDKNSQSYSSPKSSIGSKMRNLASSLKMPSFKMPKIG